VDFALDAFCRAAEKERERFDEFKHFAVSEKLCDLVIIALERVDAAPATAREGTGKREKETWSENCGVSKENVSFAMCVSL